jgi:type IV pilus assembly protein PilV
MLKPKPDIVHGGCQGAGRHGRPRQQGFNLVEVLVALVILAVGLLGIAALYLDSLRAGRTAIYRTQAINLAADMGDRIRSNRNAVASYATTFTTAAPAAVATCENDTGCSAAQMAQNDLSRWKALVALLLPGGQAQITVTAGIPNAYVIALRWTEAGSDELATFQLRVET